MKYKNEFKYLIRLCCSMYICSLVYRFYFLANFHKVRLVSPRLVLFKKAVMKNSAKFSGKHLRWTSLFRKLQVQA